MEESRRRGGGGGAAVSKNAARHADAFGPPQRKFASGRLDDYAEIFGDLAGSCSIPFLDLQPALEGLALPAAGFDYSEVFRALDFGEFSAPCEELFPAPRREAAVAALSVNGRTTAETTSSQQATVKLNFSTRHSNGGHMANKEADWSSSNSNCSDNGSMRLNVSHTKSTKQSTEATMNGKTNAAQYNDTPASSFVINTPSSIQNIGGDGIDIRKQQKIISVTSTDNSKCPENSMHADQNDLANSKPVPKDDHANASHHSRSSSSSISSGDASSSNVTYVTVSDISLRTQPLGVPPPSRPPPRSSDKQGCPKPRILSSPILYLDEVALSKPVAKDRVHRDVVKDNSPSFFDVEIDVSSAAAASAAAIKEAMELAQAKLKSAKVLMEKKRDSLQNSRKLGNHESVKRKERMMGQISIGQESFEENLAASQKINEATSAAKLTQHCEEMETVEVLSKEDEQSRQRNDLKSYKVSKSADKSEKWETNKEYHELVNSDKYEMTEEVFEREGSMKKAKLMATICEAKQNDSIKDALVYEIESNRNLRKENLVVAPSVHEENADLEADGLHVEEVEKLEEIHKLHRQEVRETEVLSFAGSDKKIKPSDNSKIRFSSDDKRGKSKLDAAVATYEGENSSNFVEINDSKEGKEEKGKSEATKCHGETIQKEISVANKTSNSSDGEGKLNVTNSTVAEEEIELQVPQRSCISKVEENEGACKCTDSENTRIEEKQCNAQNVEQLEGTIAMHEQEKKEEQHMKQQSCLSSENELRHEVDQETTKLEEDISEWKSSVGATACNEQVELMKAAKVVCWQDCNGDNAKEAQLELQHRDTKEDEFPESYSRENFEGQKVYKKELWGSGNEGIVEIQVGCDFMDKILSVDPVISRGPLNMAFDFQPTNLSREGGNLSIVSMKGHPVTSQKIISDIKKAEEQEKGIVLREKQQIIKQERRLEEEKKKEKFQEENKVKTSLLEERKEIQRKLEEDIERARLFDEEKERERKLEEEKERDRSLEEANERERKLKVEKEQARLLEEAIERERKLKEEKERSRLAEEAKEKEKKLEEKEQARLLEETKEKERKLKEEKEQARLLEEAKEREKKLEEEQARLLEKTKGREKKIVDEQSKFSEERIRRGRKLEEEKDRARLSEEGKDNERKLEEERAKLLEKVREREKKQQEKEREREREKDRAAVERATREAHERAFAEARERAERIAVERVTSEVWQRALKEAQEKAEKTSLGGHEKSSTDKASREARLRAERAAVERATAEARERAAERALAGKAAADAREHAERNNGTSRNRMRKDTVTEVHLKAKDKDGPHDGQLCSNGALSSYQTNYDSNDRCEGESVLRCKARLERHQRIAERAAKALAEKNIRDILAQREQAERDRLSEFLDADVKRWSNGKEGNLRALLSTLQYILGPESGWQPIPLTDVITAAAVKKAYRKATLWVHPDKLQQRGASIQQKYICEKVFDLLKEAWNRFNSEER